MVKAAERGVKGSRGKRECFFFNGGERRRNHLIALLMAFHPTDGEISFSPHFFFLPVGFLTASPFHWRDNHWRTKTHFSFLPHFFFLACDAIPPPQNLLPCLRTCLNMLPTWRSDLWSYKVQHLSQINMWVERQRPDSKRVFNFIEIIHHYCMTYHL